MVSGTNATYVELLDLAERLEPSDQLRLLEGLATLLRRELDHGAQHSITELRGLGKEIWQDIDAQEYVNQERSTWDG